MNARNPSIPPTMKAAVLYGWNDLRYGDFATPQFGPDEVLCRVRGCGICGTDLHIVNGNLEGLFPPHFPFIVGHEWFGEIAAMGEAVEAFSIGQRVIGEVQKGCGACARCLEGRYHLCLNSPQVSKGYHLYGHNSNGAYAEYIAVKASVLRSMPETLGTEEGVCAQNVAIGMQIVRRGSVDLGDGVVVIGLGLLGLIVIQLAKISGAAKVIAVGRGYRLERAGELGADELVDRSKEKVVERVKELTRGTGGDVVFECAGAREAVQQSLDCVRRGGRVVLAGVHGQPVTELNTNRICLDEIDLVGSRGGPNALTESIALLATRRINVQPLVTHQLPLSEVQKGFKIFKERAENVIRVALIP